jgi:PleD family two-component response regulator
LQSDPLARAHAEFARSFDCRDGGPRAHFAWLDLGVNDYLVRPIDCNELVARVRTQLRRKRYADSLRDNVQTAIEMAMIDPLTGLNNRRYLESHLATLLDQAAHRGRPLSLMILDSITSKPSTTPTATMPAMKS